MTWKEKLTNSDAYLNKAGDSESCIWLDGGINNNTCHQVVVAKVETRGYCIDSDASDSDNGNDEVRSILLFLLALTPPTAKTQRRRRGSMA